MGTRCNASRLSTSLGRTAREQVTFRPLDDDTGWYHLAGTAGAARKRGSRAGICTPPGLPELADLLEERLGVRYCFATWSFHAATLLGPGRTLTDLGFAPRSSVRGRRTRVRDNPRVAAPIPR